MAENEVQIPNKDLNRAKKAEERKKKAEERSKKSSSKKQSATGPFAFLKAINDWLEKVPARITAAFDNFVKSGETLTQEKVDRICIWLSWKVNIAIERVRQRVLKVLHDQYQTTAGGRVLKTANAIKKFCTHPIDSIGSLASALFAPLASVFAWVKVLVVELPRLAENLANIVAVLPPDPPEPHINYDKFKLKVGTINMSLVTADPNDLPAPEVLFPEPPKPFSASIFEEEFNEASANLKSAKMQYTLSEEDKNSLQGVMNLEAPSATEIIGAIGGDIL